jgi:primosomal protein N' (replication factor Y)
VLGTRLAVFSPLPDLALIVVDEEHDASFKQQDGMRYSARDVAVFRAHERKASRSCSARRRHRWRPGPTPPPETPARYKLLTLPERASNARLPAVQRIDTRQGKTAGRLVRPLLLAIEKRLSAASRASSSSTGAATRRCWPAPPCGWISHCTRCAANLVLHLADRAPALPSLRLRSRVPRACPTCGNQDIQPFGRGTQRSKSCWPNAFRKARILRVDRDSAKSRKQWEVLVETDPRRRGRHPGRHADAGQGPRFPQADAGRRGRRRCRAVRRRLPRARAPVCPVDAGRRPQPGAPSCRAKC